MSQDVWTALDGYFAERLAAPDPALAAALAANAATGLPPHDVTACQGQLLHLLARIAGARRILEVGTLGGISTIWLARALPAGGRLVTLELNPRHAEIARANLERAGLADRVEVRVGPALASLARLTGEGGEPFDFVFLDADKEGLADQLHACLALARIGTAIVADNVVREGAVLDAASADPSVRGVRRMIDALAAEPRVRATAIQTVGSKGHDGFAVALVVA